MTADPRALTELLEESQDLQADALRPTHEALDELVETAHAQREDDAAASLAGTALLGAAGGAILVGALASAAAASSSSDVQILQTAASIENLAVSTYKTALTLPYIGGSSANPVVTKFSQVTMGQHAQHADAFNAAVKSLGGKAQTYVKDTALATKATNKALLASIMGIEAQHVSVLLAVQALLMAGAPQLISLSPGTAAMLPAAAGSVGFPNAFYKTNSAAPAGQGAVK